MEFPEKISTVQIRLWLFKPLFKLFNLSESLSSLNSCWVVLLKNLDEHLGKLVLKEAPLTHTLNVKLYALARYVYGYSDIYSWIQCWDTAAYSGSAAKWLDTGIQRATNVLLRYNRQDTGEIQ